MWGPVAFIWIILGSVFAGAVHDYFSGMLSVLDYSAFCTFHDFSNLSLFVYST